jgi:rubrerythrin
VSDLVGTLRDGRRREREQAFFYRLLAGDAEAAGDEAAAERLNGLLADEQHHVSRLTARLLELGEQPGEESSSLVVPSLGDWESVARVREEDEVRWYEAALHRIEDEHTVAVLREILKSERHHRERLAGKWMPAGSTEPPEETRETP